MTEPILVSNISPERLAKWKRRYPIHWRTIIRVFDEDAVIRRGDADQEFKQKAYYRTWELMLSIYDMACPTERHRQGWRKSFRVLLAEHPILEKVFPAFRWRLNEHDQWVKHGMDALDPDEIEGGGDGTA